MTRQRAASCDDYLDLIIEHIEYLPSEVMMVLHSATNLNFPNSAVCRTAKIEILELKGGRGVTEIDIVFFRQLASKLC